ncbi:Uncharacterized conserved protein YcfJ, contains glycine zipper 2TM domain [Noviherbaspirillum humi]|uniref:Uncharacterized conserved protein YcfJ, contains glycine zipper 2TM domain n=1 Tax=Noviherbaspirillum humi TaxID=1688639 RepID=A0A239DKX4_9BURK|nr:glycine zipper 2TM domain-containing protein [Noviherbaspirillum humi]SNS33096.1 Uncharacterized conserved protein YcfJ, contains glycine zipper 2TM domain [Noviherbaspirillum humi]
MNKRIPTSAALMAMLFTAAGVQAADFEEYGRVVAVAPQTEQYNQPQQECRTEYVQVQQPQPQQRGMGGSILGGVAGGILGNQVGGGNGRTVATAVGAIAGAIAGDRVENNGAYAAAPNTVYEQPVQRCRMVDHWQTRTNGYAVTYEYQGRTHTSVLPYHPGERIRLRVSVVPQL